ncbi:hypothetical protein ACIQM4_27860 [Streptomyces sp. NPDC091272]|uniref:hypothetical protein n=1 Tax=Streptomyces sp. NPDC091272 TaxID=3365981 RepID=UPI0038247F48
MESTPPHGPQQNPGSMVGLFWIGAHGTYVGMPPVEPNPGVLLSPAGPQIVGPAPRQWSWPEVMDLRVTEAPVRSAATRWATRAATLAMAALDAWVPGSPTEMTVVLSSGSDEIKTPVYSGASSAYTQREVDLSLGLLARMVRGEFSPSAMSDWWEKTQPDEVLRSRHRVSLLEEWLSAG